MEKNKDTMILGKNIEYSLDTRKTGINNNVLVVGASGTGKTRGIVIPNILQAAGSYIVLDPKGNLYQKHKAYLEKKGYSVKKLDFTDPICSVHYNPLEYIENIQDIVKISHMLIYGDGGYRRVSPFWDESSQMLLQSTIAFLWETCMKKDRNMINALRMLRFLDTEWIDYEYTLFDKMMKRHEIQDRNSYAVKMYKMIRVSHYETMRSILIYAFSKLGSYDSPELNQMMEYDDIDIVSIGKKKTALFVVVSDTDRSMDGLANIFFSQAMNVLCSYADKKCPDNRLPVPVRFILDDFATNCIIEEFPRMIASIRSRDISVMAMLQSESQLKKAYGQNGKTIIGNCDTYVYMGGNDVETARSISVRCDRPLTEILDMQAGASWIFRRGEKPRKGENIEL